VTAIPRRLAILSAAAGLLAAGSAMGQELGKPAPASLYGVEKAEIAALPDPGQVAAAQPPRKAEGSAAAHCTAGPSGALEGCTVMLQRGGPAFGAALLSLAPAYRLTPAAGRAAGTDVVISASWPVVDIAPDWVVQPKEGDFATTTTPSAWKYDKPGFAVVNCLVGRLGTTYDCMVTLQQPLGKGFGTMLLRLAPYFKLKPARVAGKPTPSAVNVPFRFTKMEGLIY